MLPEIPVKRWQSDDNPLEECRNLVRALMKKTDALYRKCRHDQDKSTHIRTMVRTLAALTIQINRINYNSRTMHTPEILEDARGIIYESVRFCDLNRFCEK